MRNGKMFYDDGYVKVKQRKQTAAELAEKLEREEGLQLTPAVAHGKGIAASFWGKAWIRAVDEWKDYESRLPAGRSLLKNGGVIDLKIEKNKVSAYVAADRLYRVNLRFREADGELMKELRRQCAGKLTSLVDFIKGELSEEVMALVSAPAYGVFPEYGDFRPDCDCLDDAVLCRHAAAVLYGIAARLDDEPSLFFTMRGIAPEDFFDISGTLSELDTEAGLSAGELSDTFGINIEF